ncbi:hypothetical protein HMPREF2562_01120 [Corynebacterium sp. HMSC077G07]|uniref:hypothetical protein n=1 Tax=Corynebacterium sp. HMSC077G07 TaxID=1715042 RepID=UPI0008A21150|nr:hypothetical protein [Corynebacterium sp. HMSC077G07]OFN37611.1 hypothetical protein HMPREF2562_01120 [Corynebacterium sp. HMSC077G07]
MISPFAEIRHDSAVRLILCPDWAVGHTLTAPSLAMWIVLWSGVWIAVWFVERIVGETKLTGK